MTYAGQRIAWMFCLTHRLVDPVGWHCRDLSLQCSRLLRNPIRCAVDARCKLWATSNREIPANEFPMVPNDVPGKRKRPATHVRLLPRVICPGS
jgi:hypothetical protein